MPLILTPTREWNEDTDADGDFLQAEYVQLYENDAVLKGSIDDLSTGLNALTESVPEQISTAVGALHTSLTNDLSALEMEINADIANISSDLSALQSEVDGLETSLAAVPGQLITDNPNWSSGTENTKAPTVVSTWKKILRTFRMICSIVWRLDTSGTLNLVSVAASSSALVAISSTTPAIQSGFRTTWYSPSAFNGTGYTSVAAAPDGSYYVSVGNGAYGESTDGQTWYSENVTGQPYSGKQWNAVCWAPFLFGGVGGFIAVGTNAVILYQPYIGWQAATTVPAGVYRAVNASTSMATAVGDGGVIMTTTDGITWFARTIGAPGSGGTSDFTGITKTGTKWIACSKNLVYPFAYSNDGINGWTWKNHTLGNTTITARTGIAYSPELDTVVSVGGTGIIMISIDDGVTWRAILNPNTGTTWTAICWASAAFHFTAVGTSSDSNRTMKTLPLFL